MEITLTGHGVLADSFSQVRKVNIHSFRKLSDADVSDIVKASDVIIHNSANTRGKKPMELVRDNLSQTKRIVQIIRKTKPEVQFIYIGSMSYLTDDGYMELHEMTPYAYTKFLSEMITVMNMVNYKCIRFSTLFYKNDERDGLSRLIKVAKDQKIIQLINSGSARRDYLPIQIAAKYLDDALTADTRPIVNICSGVETSFFQVAKILQRLTGCEIKFDNAIVPKVRSSFKRVLKEIPFNLEDEIKDYLKKV